MSTDSKDRAKGGRNTSEHDPQGDYYNNAHQLKTWHFQSADHIHVLVSKKNLTVSLIWYTRRRRKNDKRKLSDHIALAIINFKIADLR